MTKTSKLHVDVSTGTVLLTVFVLTIVLVTAVDIVSRYLQNTGMDGHGECLQSSLDLLVTSLKS